MHDESVKRSVDNLQRIYTVVISLAITESLRRLLSSFGDNKQLPELASILAVFSLIITIVPFYHGANRYLDSTYVTGERSAKSGALMLDFIAIFFEGLVFFILALLISYTNLFFSILAMLFVFDSIWVWITKLTSNSKIDNGLEYRTWETTNIMAAVFIFVSFWSNILNWEFWPSDTIRVVAAAIIVILRTITDYATVWKFYYPIKTENDYLMPVPRPAIPITEDKVEDAT